MAWHLVEKNDLKYFQLTVGTVSYIQSTVHGAESLMKTYDPVLLKQVHSDVIINIDLDQSRTGDGLLTARKVNLGVKVADCLPVFMFGTDRTCIIHCGWRSIAKGLAVKAAQILVDYTYCLGASIGSCCYDVKDDVAQQFSGVPGALVRRGTKTYLDLKKAVIHQLGASRLISSLDLCTKCHPEYFYSYRRGDRHKRNYALIVHE
jgi:copper oxidase (laccase) domain-containing protein